MENLEYILEIKGIKKAFPGVQALDGVDLLVKKGKVHALVGENGAGKSTLMKILLGIYSFDSGTIKYRGKFVHFANTHQALSHGLTMIHQELSPVLDMTVEDNVFLGREPSSKIAGLVNSKEIHKKTIELFNTLEFKGISPKSIMKDLSVAQMQLVEIAKAVSYNAELIIMDEPTSALSEAEVEALYKIIYKLKKQGIAIIYISHKLEEIFKIADEVTVFRDGRYIGSDLVENLSRETLIQMMVGRELKDFYNKEKAKIGETVFEVKNLSKEGVFKNISFKLHKSEILGVAGLMGSGRSEIVETIFGMHGVYEGDIYKDGKKIKIKRPMDAIKNKIALVPEDRKGLGLFLILTIKYNITISYLKHFSKLLFIKEKKEKAKSEEIAKLLRIKAASIDSITNTLSGGNQQKVVLAKWLMTLPDIIFFDEPTRGIDVGAKAEIYNIMIDLAKQGKSMIMISSEMPELLAMSDRIIVVHNGKITGELSREEATQEKILDLAAE